MDLKINMEMLAFLGGLLTNLIVVVVMFTTMRNRLGFLFQLFQDALKDSKAQVLKFDLLHQRHFDHAANTGIHQESMSRETLAVHFQTLELATNGLATQFRSHTEEDMEVFRSISKDLQDIRDRLPAKAV